MFASKDSNTSIRVGLPEATDPLTLCTAGFARFPASGEDLATSAQDERIGGGAGAAVLIFILSSARAGPPFAPPVTQVGVSLDSSGSVADCSLGMSRSDSVDSSRLAIGVSFSPLTGISFSVPEGVVEGGSEET